MQQPLQIPIHMLEEYLFDRYHGWTNEQHMFMKLVEEIGEVAEVLNRMAGRKADDGSDLKKALGSELSDMIHYIVAIAALSGIDLSAAMLEKDRIASEKYGHDTNLTRFLSERLD